MALTRVHNRLIAGAPVNVKDFGAVGDGVTDDTAAIQAALTFAVGSDILFPKGTYVFTGSVINNTCVFNNSSIQPSSDLVFGGDIIAGRYQIFKGTADITCAYTDEIYPEWFNILSDSDGDLGTTNKEAENKRMMRCVQTSEGHLVFGAGTYYMRDLLIDQNNVTVSGQGRKTVIQNSPFWNSSTRLGTVVSFYGPTIEGGISPSVGNNTWTANESKRNCVIKDLDIAFDDTGLATDDTMNGLAIVGFSNVTVERVNINLNGANRAFYIGTFSTDHVTNNVIVRDCKSYLSSTGVFISEGLTTTSTGQELKNIVVECCEFNVISRAGTDPKGASSGLYHHSASPSTTIKTGNINFKNNYVIGGTCGVFQSGPGASSRLTANLIVENNEFENFLEQGILTYAKRATFSNNLFDSTVMNATSTQLAAILCTSNAQGGCLNINIVENKIKNLSGTGTIRGIHFNPSAGLNIKVVRNEFLYEDGNTPQYDLFYSDGTGIAGDIILSGNYFYDTGAANVRGTTTNDALYYDDMGNNVNLNLYSALTKKRRRNAPTETTRRWVRGDFIAYDLAGVGAGTQVGWVCYTTGSPGVWRSALA